MKQTQSHYKQHFGYHDYDYWAKNATRYVEGRVYTNGMENYWRLLDRMLHGAYVYCSPAHMFRYTDELSYRFNNRGGTDCTRFLKATMQIVGKRLTYDELTTGHLMHIDSK